MKAKQMKRKNQRDWFVALIIICLGVVVAGGFIYVSSLREDLTDQAILNVQTVTVQQQQAFDNFIAGDRERLHSFAVFFSHTFSDQADAIQRQLSVFCEVDAFYTVINLDTGRFYSSKSDECFQMKERELEIYRSLTGSGVRDPYTGLYTENTMFGYYECFQFADGARGLIQKSYDRSKVSETFSLSFYNNRGLTYVVNQRGDILLRSIGKIGDQWYDNIFAVLTSTYGDQEEIARFAEAISDPNKGSMIFEGEAGAYVYTHVPVENVKGWFLVSIVPLAAITEATDQILLNSQQVFALLMIILVVFAVFLLLIWQTHRDMLEKDKKIAYQEQLFNIFSTYLSNNTDDVYMMIDLEGERAEYVSPNVERVLGVSEKNAVSALRSAEGNVYAAMVNGNGKEGSLALETVNTERINPQTGEHKWFQESAYCIEIQGRRKLVLYISDRTREKKDQNMLAEALEMAQAANKAKSAFLSSVSHDIRTPMNAIIGFVALLREDADDPAHVLDYTQRIEAASQHLLGLINDVLDMNKIESGSATLNISEVNLAVIIDEINTIIRPQAQARDQKFEIFSSSLVHEQLLGDKVRINQILINLLSNAVKYTPPGGEIQMRIEELPQAVKHYSRVRFTVKDNGQGMSEEYQRVIFDPFSREENCRTNQIQGTGLGMAITKSLVDLMGGTIKVSSELGKGSIFTVELELYIQEKENDPQFWEDHNIRRMIVADDEEEICKNIVHTMSLAGVQTRYATNGFLAVQMMQEARERGEPYDLILLDWSMPKLDGLATARLIRSNYSQKIPILLLTAYDWGEIEQEAKEIGVSHFLSKPFFMSTFKEAVRRFTQGQQKKERLLDDSVAGRRFLVVDDIEVNRLILVKILKSMGADSDVAADGQEALEMFEASDCGEYDAIFMDVQMPVMDGYTATKAIRASAHPCAKTVPIIAMTANAFVEDVREALAAGMNVHLAKPVQVDKLKAAVIQVLKQPQAAGEEGQKESF